MTQQKPASVALAIIMLLALVYFLLPLYWVLVTITKDNSQLNTTFGLWFALPWNLVENIRDLFAKDNGVFSKWILNSFFYFFTVLFFFFFKFIGKQYVSITEHVNE